MGCGCSSANKCLLKVAAYAAQLEQYQKAIEIYEQVSSHILRKRAARIRELFMLEKLSEGTQHG